jgi:hypothetical protein
MTEIDVIRGGSLLFSRSASVVREEPADDAEFIRRLDLEVVRSVQAARATVANVDLDGVVVAAPANIGRTIAEKLSDRLAAPGWLLDPADRLSLPRPMRDDAGEFAAVLGLALGHGDRGAPPFDFLHPHRPIDLSARRRRRRLVLAGAAAAVVLIGLVGNYAMLAAARARNDALAGELSDLRRRAKPIERVAEAVRVARGLPEAGPDWLGEYARANAMWLSDRVLHKSAHIVSFDSARTRDGGWKIEVEGLAYRPENIDEIETRLRRLYNLDSREGRGRRVVVQRAGLNKEDQHRFRAVIEYEPPRRR